MKVSAAHRKATGIYLRTQKILLSIPFALRTKSQDDLFLKWILAISPEKFHPVSLRRNYGTHFRPIRIEPPDMRRITATLTSFTAMACLSQAATIRFIEVTSNPGAGGTGGSGAFFHIGEVEAFLTSVVPAAGLDNANDLALSVAGATASTTSGTVQHGGDLALISGAVGTGAGTWSRNVTASVEATALVDLGGSFDVGTVRVWQRGDGCCQDRLRNFTVNLYADDGSGSVGALVDSIANTGQVATNSFATFTPVPEPSAALLGLLGGALALRRRR